MFFFCAPPVLAAGCCLPPLFCWFQARSGYSTTLLLARAAPDLHSLRPSQSHAKLWLPAFTICGEKRDEGGEGGRSHGARLPFRMCLLLPAQRSSVRQERSLWLPRTCHRKNVRGAIYDHALSVSFCFEPPQFKLNHFWLLERELDTFYVKLRNL